MPKNRQLLKRILKKKNLEIKDFFLSSSRVKLSLRFFYFLKKSSDFSKLEKKFNVWFFKRNSKNPFNSSRTRKINNLKLIV